MVEVCERAAQELARHGVDATVWDIRAAAPLDPVMLSDALRHRVIITAEDGILAGGVGASINAVLRGQCDRADLPFIASFGLPLRYFPQGKADQILSRLGLDGPQLAQRALSLL